MISLLAKNSFLDLMKLFLIVGKNFSCFISYPYALILFFNRTSNIGNPIVPQPATPTPNDKILLIFNLKHLSTLTCFR